MIVYAYIANCLLRNNCCSVAKRKWRTDRHFKMLVFLKGNKIYRFNRNKAQNFFVKECIRATWRCRQRRHFSLLLASADDGVNFLSGLHQR